MGSFKRSDGGCLCGLRINCVWMNSFLLFLFYWFLSSVIQSDSASPDYTSNTAEIRASNSTYPDPSGSGTASVSSGLQHFNCRHQVENGLAIFCTNVDMVALAPNIPNDTVHLEITESPLPVFTKPLLSHLGDLRYLKLNHNAHRYVTSKALQGLHNLKVLDLSFNDIIVLSKAFTHTPNLEVLNLTSNQVINVKTIATSLSGLKNFRNLSLNHNVRIRKIFRDELLPFSNTSLVKLELYNTTIELVEQHTFRPLRHLKLLELSVNYLDAAGLQNVTSDLGETSVEILFLRNIQIQNGLPYEALSYLGNTSIIRLDLGYNYFPVIRSFPPIPSLKSLWFPYCSIWSIEFHAFNDLPELEVLELSDNQIYVLDENMFMLPRLNYLLLSNQKSPDNHRNYFTVEDYAFKNLSTLSYLDLRKVWLKGGITRYTFYGLRSLRDLSLSTARIESIEDYAFETLVSLETLDLKNNLLSHLTNYTFFGLSKLDQISLSQNSIKFAPGVYPFENSPSLSVVLLQSNEIVEIPPHMFSRLSLLNTLILSTNKLVAWNSTILPHEANISALLLSQNQISHVTPAMNADFMSVNDILDVTDNPFNCSACGMKDFQQFIKRANVTCSYTNNMNISGTYTCYFPAELRGQPMLEVDIPVEHCLPLEIHLNMAIFIAAVTLSVIIPVILVSVLCHVFRWYIRYCFFRLEAKLKARRHNKDDQKRYVYDAFVSYNASDTPWVISTLIPALEEQEPRFKLCIHERDFEVGRLITDNILDTIEVSRKVILLLSESFLKSEWCMFELHMAQHKLFDETRDVLVLVKLKDINKKMYTKNLKYLEKTRPCLSWTDNPMGQKLFWNKMRKALDKSSTE